MRRTFGCRAAAAACLAVLAGGAAPAAAGDDVLFPGGAALDTLAAIEAAPPAAHDIRFYGGMTDTITVTAPRAGDVRLPVAAALTTVVPLDGAAAGADLAALLARVAGLQMRRYGGLGAEATPSIRGSTGAQVQVMVDGVPLADAQDGGIDLSTLPLDRFARAEVQRGLPAAAHGGLGGSGAVNLITRHADGRDGGLRLSAGSFGEAGGRWLGGFSSADGGRAGLALVHGRRLDNRYSYLDHNQTFANPDDDARRTRANADLSEWGAYLGGRWENASWRALASSGFFRREGGRPGPLAYPSPTARVRLTRADGRLGLESRDGALRLDLAASQTRDLLHDDGREVGWDPAGTVRGTGSDLLGRIALARSVTRAGAEAFALRWEGGADWRRQWYRELAAGAADPLRTRTTQTVFAGLRGDFYGPRLTLLPSWRWQRAADDFPPLPALPWLPETPLPEPHVVQAVAPAAAVIWEASPARLIFEAHASRTSRLPTWIELFGHRGGIDGNRSLEPERLTSGGLACRWRSPGGGLIARLALFHNRSDRTIVFVQNSQRTSKAQNIGAARTQGLEAEAAGRLPGGGEWSTNLTWQSARDRGADPIYRGKQLPFLPPLETHLALEQPIGPWRAGASITHQSANYRDRYNQELDRAPARTLLDLSLARSWRPSGARLLTVTAAVINLTGNGIYDVEGFPLPGRTFRLAAEWR